MNGRGVIVWMGGSRARPVPHRGYRPRIGVRGDDGGHDGLVFGALKQPRGFPGVASVDSVSVVFPTPGRNREALLGSMFPRSSPHSPTTNGSGGNLPLTRRRSNRGRRRLRLYSRARLVGRLWASEGKTHLLSDPRLDLWGELPIAPQASLSLRAPSHHSRGLSCHAYVNSIMCESFRLPLPALQPVGPGIHA